MSEWPRYYILVDRVPLAVDLMTWALRGVWSGFFLAKVRNNDNERSKARRIFRTGFWCAMVAPSRAAHPILPRRKRREPAHLMSGDAVSILLLGPDQEAHIKLAIEIARAKPVPWSVLEQIACADDLSPTLLISDRKGPVELARGEFPSQHVMLGTYEAALSFEEQPTGLYRHLSVSSHRGGRVPGPEVMEMVCRAFGFSDALVKSIALGDPSQLPDWPARVWLEEFDPGHFAVNVVERCGGV